MNVILMKKKMFGFFKPKKKTKISKEEAKKILDKGRNLFSYSIYTYNNLDNNNLLY